ncbi:transcription termination/antitermination NusG family protein [Gemmobacter sp. 24YEA27]|uniref:transcription termination/antitermination protein NusG n=1 Tax=Gemmobacter sp. 24YEA27 TaxID=3040672 RepID=UPI0024B3B8C0|nr:transcription termination/antitermination NusG family protein [Gemmobacter sp. 24YEA27]
MRPRWKDWPRVWPRAAIFTPGKPDWYALRVAPQREDEAEAWLGIRGVSAFHPVLARQVRRHGILREYHRRYLPGYVFARFKGEPLPHRVMSCPWIIGALCLSNGEWGVLERSGLRKIHAMRKIDAGQRDARAALRARRLAEARLRSGDGVMFRSGPFAGFRAEVVELKAEGGAMVKFELFGRETLIAATDDALIPLKPS